MQIRQANKELRSNLAVAVSSFENLPNLFSNYINGVAISTELLNQ